MYAMKSKLSVSLLVVLLVSNAVLGTPTHHHHRHHGSAGSCSMPTAAQLRLSLVGAGGGDGAASNEPAFSGATVSGGGGGRACPAGDAVLATMEVNEAAGCPWAYEVEDVPDRFPRFVTRAVCRCNRCLDLSTGLPIPDSSCTPVTYPMKVLNRVGCEDGTYTYAMQTIDVPVACSCRRPVIAPSGASK